MIRSCSENVGTFLNWKENHNDEIASWRAESDGVRYELHEAMGDYVLWVGKGEKNALVAISEDRSELLRDADTFAAKLVPYAAHVKLDLVDAIQLNPQHTSTLWTLLTSPEFFSSEAENANQQEEK